MWHALASGETPEQTADLLLQHYDTSRDTLLGDCLRLIDELLRRGLVTLAPEVRP